MNMLSNLIITMTIIMTILIMTPPLNYATFTIPITAFNTLPLNASLMMDWMSLTFMMTVLLITSTMTFFNLSYIPNKEQPRFLILLILFMISMLILIMSNNFILLLLGWDGLGLTSYLLVIYYQNSQSSASGLITILTNRIGDISIILVLSVIIFSKSLLLTNPNIPHIALFLLMAAAMSKSAQYPFSAWLPAAMAAPTPVSALVHSSTLVTAGVFLMIRLTNYSHPLMTNFLLPITIMTTVLASLSACWEQDLKKIIALSTLSQIAMMMFAVAIKCPNTAFFHLITHAFFKSTMFMTAGFMIHSSQYQDFRMVNTFIHSPISFTTMTITSMALMGMPFMAGFYSKDAIIEFMIQSSYNSTLIMIMCSSLPLTVLYSMCLMTKSNPMNTNSHPSQTTHTNNMMTKSMIIMTPLSIMSGAMLTWNTIPNQLIMIPLMMKLLILFLISTTLIMTTALQFKSMQYKKLMNNASSLWFNHQITTLSSKILYNSQKLLSIDHSWNEMNPPQLLNKTSNLMNTQITSLSKSTLFMIILTITLPALTLY